MSRHERRRNRYLFDNHRARGTVAANRSPKVGRDSSPLVLASLLFPRCARSERGVHARVGLWGLAELGRILAKRMVRSKAAPEVPEAAFLICHLDDPKEVPCALHEVPRARSARQTS
jgi:hypothetical protein